MMCYSYDGRPMGSIKFPGSSTCLLTDWLFAEIFCGAGMRTELLGSKTLALAPDTVAVLDRSDGKSVLLLDPANGKPAGDAKITHSVQTPHPYPSLLLPQATLDWQQEIVELGLDQTGPAGERRLAFIDKNADLFIAATKSFGSSARIVKLGGCDVKSGAPDSVWSAQGR